MLEHSCNTREFRGKNNELYFRRMEIIFSDEKYKVLSKLLMLKVKNYPQKNYIDEEFDKVLSGQDNHLTNICHFGGCKVEITPETTKVYDISAEDGMGNWCEVDTKELRLLIDEWYDKVEKFVKEQPCYNGPMTREKFEEKMELAKSDHPDSWYYQNALKNIYDNIGCEYIVPSNPRDEYKIVEHDYGDLYRNGGLNNIVRIVDEVHFYSELNRDLDRIIALHEDDDMFWYKLSIQRNERLREQHRQEFIRKRTDRKNNIKSWILTVCILILSVLILITLLIVGYRSRMKQKPNHQNSADYYTTAFSNASSYLITETTS